MRANWLDPADVSCRRGWPSSTGWGRRPGPFQYPGSGPRRRPPRAQAVQAVPVPV